MARDCEMSVIEEALEDAEADIGQILVTSAGFGAGKTALLKAAATEARQRGTTVFTARGSYPERNLAFGLVGRLFESTIQILDADELQTLRDAAPRLAAALDAPNDTHNSHPADIDAWLPDLNVLNRILTRLAARGPLMLVVDDAHWADRSSLHWLSALPARIERLPVVVLASVNAGMFGPEPQLLEELAATSAADLPLEPLGFSAIRTVMEDLVGAPVERSLVSAGLEATRGNPLLVTELVRAWSERAGRPDDDAVTGLIDTELSSVAALVHAQLRHVSPHALSVARAVTVLAPSATIARVAQLTGIDLHVVGDTVWSLNRMGLIDMSGHSLRIAYPLVRKTLARNIALGTMQTMQATAARLLESTGAPPRRVAEHLLASPAPLDEAWVAPTLRHAANEALHDGDPESAIACLNRALVEPVPTELHAELLCELGRAETHRDIPAAIRYLAESARRCPQSINHTRRTAELAELLTLVGRHDEATELVQESAADTSEAARAKSQSLDHDLDARLLELQLFRLDSAGTARDRLDELRPPEPDTLLSKPRLNSLFALADSWTGTSRAAAVAAARQVLANVPARPEGMTAYLRAATVLMHAGLLDQAHHQSDKAVIAARQWQHDPCLAAALSARSAAARQLGLLHDAAQDARTGLALLEGCGATTTTVHLARLIEVLTDIGEHDEATSRLRAAKLTGEIPATWAGAAILFARGRLRVATGHIEDGLRDLLESGSMFSAWRVDNPAIAPWRSEAALGLMRIGKMADSRGHATREVQLARRWAAPGPLGAALRVQGMAHGSTSGRAMLEESVAVLKDSGANLALLRSLAELGSALHRSHETFPARRHIDEAVDLAAASGSSYLIKQTETRLGEAGTQRSCDQDSSQSALTRAEQRVVDLAMQGKTNDEIAKILFVQRRTVEFHLTNTYRKLGIDRREQLASAFFSQ